MTADEGMCAYLLGNKGPWRVTEQENKQLISTISRNSIEQME